MRFWKLTLLAAVLCWGIYPQGAGGRRTVGPGGRPRSPWPPATTIKPEDYAKVEGTVYDAITGAPLKKARLTLYGTRPRHRTVLTAVTDAAGHFLFRKVEPGKYRLSVRRNRYASQAYGQRRPGTPGAMLTVRPRQHIQDIVFKLVPGAVVTGRVVDEDGEPVPYVGVSVMRYRYRRGHRELVPVGGSATTNDLGEYRLFGISPGKYYVAASNRMRFMRGGAGVSLTADGGLTSYPTVYYPGVLDPTQAAPIQLRGGQEQSGVDFRLVPVRAYRIFGRVTLGGGRLPPNVVVTLFSQKNSFLSGFSRAFALVDRRTGKFELKGVRPGSYALVAVVAGPQTARLFARRTVEVGSADVQGVILPLGPGATVAGEVSWDGPAPAETTLDELSVYLEARQGRRSLFGVGRALVSADGSFEAKNVAPGSYRVKVYGMPPDAYLKQARYGDQDVLASGFEVGEGGGGPLLKLVVGLQGGRLDGTVVAPDHQPQTGATVVLIPEKAERERDDLYKRASTDQYGHFTIRGLPPGHYTVYALDDLEPGAEYDPEFRKRHRDDGQDVKIQERNRATVQLELVQAAS